MPWYRLHVVWTYSKVADANSAQAAINTTLTNAGRTEQATRDGSTVDVLCEPLTAAEAESLRNALTVDWNKGVRTDGRASVVLRD